jgi:NAD(P)-dependent dehydrogenase (short-subunit alcohol dehydrogenase family)
MALFDLTGNIAVVTGATKGIGRGIVERMCEHGATVVVSSRNQEECDATASELNERYGKRQTVAVGVAADLLDLDSLNALVEKTLARFGRIDTLVCNAAILPFLGPSSQTPPEHFSRMMEGNIQNTFRLCHLVMPGMRRRKSGSVVIIGSVSGVNAALVDMVYGVSKAAQGHMAKCLAAEVVGDGVRVNCVAPGLIRSYSSTPIWSDPNVLETMLDGIPLHRIGEPDDIAAGVIFLASQAGSYVTGATIAIDGGLATIPPPSKLSEGLGMGFPEGHIFS